MPPGHGTHGKRDTFLALMKQQNQILEELRDLREGLRRVEGRIQGEGRKQAEETKQPDPTVVDIDPVAARDALQGAPQQDEAQSPPAAPSIRDMNGLSVLCY